MPLKLKGYETIKSLQYVYLEDSFVLGIDQNMDSISFDLDLVLKEEHELYATPKRDEQYCYVKAKLKFSALRKVVWKELRMWASIDANMEIDFGNIDSFRFSGDRYQLSGDWGEIYFEADNLELDIAE